jgi:uncharacterized protein (DUF2147 family)
VRNITRRTSILSALTLVIILAATHSLSADSRLHGEWKRGDGNVVVSIAPCGLKTCSTNTWIGDTSGGENIGDRLIMNLDKGSGSVLAGEAYDPRRNLTYKLKIDVSETRFISRGCLALGMLCKNASWQRLSAR